MHIKLGFSKQFCGLWAFLMLGSLFSVSYVSLPFVLKTALIAVILVYGSYILRQYILLKNAKSIVAIVSTNPDEFQLCDAKDKILPGKLRGDSTCTRWVSILRFDVPDYRFAKTCIIFKDAITPDLYRKLMVHLF